MHYVPLQEEDFKKLFAKAFAQEKMKYDESLEKFQKLLTEEIDKLYHHIMAAQLSVNLLNKRVSEIEKSRPSQQKLQEVIYNLRAVMDKLNINWCEKFPCARCESRGIVYIPTICDTLQGNQCPKCHGDGFIWI